MKLGIAVHAPCGFICAGWTGAICAGWTGANREVLKSIAKMFFLMARECSYDKQLIHIIAPLV